MTTEDQAILTGVLVALSLLVVVANDWLKKRAHRRAIRKREQPKEWTENHETSWSFVAVVVVLGVIMIGTMIFSQRHVSRAEKCASWR